jgi:hypothetical protein
MSIRLWFTSGAMLAVASLLMACGSGAENPQHSEGTVVPDDAKISAVEQAASRDDLWFETAKTLDVLSYGAVGDGMTDNTEVFRRVLAGGNRTIQIPTGDYVSDSLFFDANTILILEPGVVIRDAGRLGPQEKLLNIRTHDVRITGFGARVVADRAAYTSGEWRHGVQIYGAQRVMIEGLESSSHGGDGFYIGGPEGMPSSDVVLKGCRADDNRRQGLSVTNARRVRIVDCEFARSNGTSPQFGVDLEPNRPDDMLDSIDFLRVFTRENRGGGILINLERLNATSAAVDITIVDHSSEHEAPRLLTGIPASVAGSVRYRRMDP